MGRKQHPCWEQVTILQHTSKTIKRVQCNHCGLKFSGGGTRIKEHFFGSKNIRPCPEFVKDNKERVYPGASLINLDSPGDKLGDSYRFKEEQMTSHEEVVDMNRELKEHEKKRVGPFSVFTTVDARDSQLIEYVFDPSLLYDNEIIISFPCLYLTREDFSTLKPRALLDSKVIDAFAEYLTYTERRKKSIPVNWYLPIMFSYCALNEDARSFLEFVGKHKMRENYMYNFVNCEKMFIPVHVNKGGGHYYLYVVHSKKKRVEIWDSLPSMKEDYRETTQRLLCALDNLFVEDLKDSGLAFKNFTWTMVDNTPEQPDRYDCGIFVIKFMQRSFNVKRSPSFQFHSEDERLRLALDLLKSDLNNQRKTLHLKAAKRDYAQSKEEDLPTPKFNKRKRTDTSIYSEEVQREEYTTSDNSRRRIKEDVSFCGLQEKSNCFKLPYDFKKGHTKGYTLPTTDLIGDQFQNYTKQMGEWLMKDEVSVIGVWGMGGVGKTELVKHVQNQLLERNDVDSFDYVIWVTVTGDCKISHVRKVIAQSIELDISDEPEEKRIIGKLFEKLREIKFLLILDDIWNPIDLKDIGIPISNNRNKLILTTRSLDVCRSMNCEKNIIKINTLEEKASWELFRKTLGENVTLSSEVEKIAQSVVKKCEGLPLAIGTIAASMKYKKQVWEWEHMFESLRNLENGQSDLEESVFPVLRSSYDHLKNKKLQECFLYCALDSAINVTESFVMEGLIDGMLGLEAQKNECQSILHKLISNSLLLEQRESLLSEKVHYLIQGMAASIVKETHMVAIDRKFIAIPEMNEKLEKVFLKCQPIREIPDGISWRCPKLSTFLLRWSNLNRIADDFFINMTYLKRLNLSETDITCLPESVSNLECLVALWLYGCKSLRYVPSLAKLRKLMWLSLHSTGITELPQGLEMLVNLRWLDLRRTPASFTTASVIPKLTNLQSLHLNCIPGSMDVKAEDILGLEMLENISAHFCDPLNFEDYVTRFPNTSPRLFSYKLSLGTSRTPSYNEYSIGQKVLEFVGVNKECSRPVLPLPKDLQKLIINQCHQWTICLCDVLYCRSYKLSRIKSCCISDCSKLEYLFCMSSYCIFCDSVQLESLELKGLARLRVLCNYNKLAPPMYLFYHLKDLSIEECHSIKKLLTPQLSAQLQNLESLMVRYCKSMKEIFSARGGEEEDEYEEASAVTLPALKSISLIGLPELNFLFRGTIVCPLSRLNISDCEKVIWPPAFLPPVPIWKILDGWST